MGERHIIRRIRKVIPTMKCKNGCHDCCGPVMFSEWEWGRVSQLKVSMAGCPYLKDDGCSIYDERPVICRLFGSTVEVSRMMCPYGYKPSRPLTETEMSNIMREYLALFSGVKDKNGQMVPGITVKDGKYVYGFRE